MPARIVPYLLGLFQAQNITATFLNRQFGFSHDQITRTLGRKCNWQILLFWVIQRLFGTLNQGFLIIDDTCIAKPYAKKLEGASVVYDSADKRYVYGYQVVLICWTNNLITLPLAWRFYEKNKQTKIELAKELLHEIHDSWQLKPQGVLFDTWYAAGPLLNLIHSFSWVFVCQIKKNRVINGCQVWQDFPDTNEVNTGLITGLVKVKIIKNDEAYFITNHRKLGKPGILRWYLTRWRIEEIFRFLKGELHLEELQARSKTAYETHLGSCLLAYLILQKEKQTRYKDQSLYFIKQEWNLNKRLGRNRINHYVKVLTA